MTNAELLAKIKTEIERLKAKYRKDMYKSSHEGLASGYKIEAYNELLSFLSTLESEKPMQEELEEEIHKYNKERFDEYFPEQDGDFISEVDFMTCLGRVARHFAQWQKEQDEISKVNYEGARAVYDNTVQHLQEKIDEKYELGKKDMKEQMLKEAVEGEVVLNPYPTICLDDCKDYDFKDGDKVRVIILPKED